MSCGVGHVMVAMCVVCCGGIVCVCVCVVSWMAFDGGGSGHFGSVHFSAGTFLVTSDRTLGAFRQHAWTRSYPLSH